MVVTAHIAVEHGSFNRIYQVVPLSNTWFLWPTRVFPKSSSAVFARLASVTTSTQTHRDIQQTTPHVTSVRVITVVYAPMRTCKSMMKSYLPCFDADHSSDAYVLENEAIVLVFCQNMTSY